MIRMIKNEAFRSGMAGEMMDKVARVLGRKIGVNIEISDIPYDYSNAYGKFSGYFAILNDGDKMLRFNVHLGKSDQIISVDIYSDVESITPDLTVETAGMNIVQILNAVESALTGKPVRERIKKGVDESPLKGAESENWKELMKVVEQGDIFEEIEEDVYLVAHKSTPLNALYIYGPPGTGKTRTVIDKLEDLGVDYERFSGGIKGVSELVRVLYRYREGYLIVFDDIDDVIRNRAQRQILSSAMGMGTEERYITWVKDKPDRKIPERFAFTSQIIIITNYMKLDPAIESRSLNIYVELSPEQMMLRIKAVIENVFPAYPLNVKMKVWRFLRRASIEMNLLIDFRQFQVCLAFSALILSKYPSSRKWKIKCLRTITRHKQVKKKK